MGGGELKNKEKKLILQICGGLPFTFILLYTFDIKDISHTLTCSPDPPRERNNLRKGEINSCAHRSAIHFIRARNYAFQRNFPGYRKEKEEEAGFSSQNMRLFSASQGKFHVFPRYDISHIFCCFLSLAFLYLMFPSSKMSIAVPTYTKKKKIAISLIFLPWVYG